MQIRELQVNWNEFGKTDPLWAILTEPGKEGNKWDLEDFFDTGKREIDELITFIKSLGFSPQSDVASDVLPRLYARTSMEQLVLISRNRCLSVLDNTIDKAHGVSMF